MNSNDENVRQADLFGVRDRNGENHDERAVEARRPQRTVASSLWAAYGDAMGFISELTDAGGLRRRIGEARVTHPVNWKRRVGGRVGVMAELPAGCWSDDTQLRLCVSRAVRREGFDVEAFARVELPVWLSYALGAGRGTKAAAANMSRNGAMWYANTFDGWTKAGGNGAAMRVQPHVWAARDLTDVGTYLPSVISDSVCTHSHPHGLAGAALHAMVLAETLALGAIPHREFVPLLLEKLDEVPRKFLVRDELVQTWRPLVEKETGVSFESAWTDVMEEAAHAFTAALNALDGGSRGFNEEAYASVLEALGLFNESVRGSGLLTSIAALVLCWIEPNPEEAAVLAANALGSDTDTIATMALAISGAANGASLPPVAPMDAELLTSEAERLVSLSCGADVSSHPYPDILTWSPPQTHADALIVEGGQLAVTGLGPAERISDELRAQQGDFGWVWVRTEFGQTLLIKKRAELPDIGAARALSDADREAVKDPRPYRDRASRYRREDKRRRDETHAERNVLDRTIDVDLVLDWIDSRLEDDLAIGQSIRGVARKGTAEQFLAYVVALRERLRS